MNGHHINETVTRSQPREAAVGEVGQGVAIDDVTSALVAAGIAADRIYYLIGPDGAEALRSARGFLSVFDEVISRPLSALDAGKTIVGVFGVASDDAAAVRKAMVAGGVVNTHYWGKWTYS